MQWAAGVGVGSNSLKEAADLERISKIHGGLAYLQRRGNWAGSCLDYIFGF